MAFCKNCGTQLPDNATFCNSCGTPVKETEPFQAQDYQANAVQPEILNGVDDATDAKQNKAMGVLSYLGILVLIPIFAAKESKFAQHHARQGVTLAVFEIGYTIVTEIIKAILRLIFPLEFNWLVGYTYGPVYNFISAVLGLASLFFTVLAIIGIVNAVKGTKKELPLIGKIDILGFILKLFKKK